MVDCKILLIRMYLISDRSGPSLFDCCCYCPPEQGDTVVIENKKYTVVSKKWVFAPETEFPVTVVIFVD